MSEDKSKKLYDGITNINEDIIEEALDAKPRNKVYTMRQWIAVAACLILFMGGILSISILKPDVDKTGGGTSGASEGLVYDAYSGPVFPLTFLGDKTDVTANRELMYDFSPYADKLIDDSDGMEYNTWTNEANVTDSYVLNNPASEAKELTLLYPFNSTLDHVSDELPNISVDGTIKRGDLCFGASGEQYLYTVKDGVTLGANGQQYITSWKDYKTLLSDGTYQNTAFTKYPPIKTPVVVYELKNVESLKNSLGDTGLAFSFKTKEGVQCLSWNYNRYRLDNNAGSHEYSIDLLSDWDYSKERILVVIVGGDIDDYNLLGYKDGEGNHSLKDHEGIVRRYETTLDGLIQELVPEEMKTFKEMGGEHFTSAVSDEMLDRACREWLAKYMESSLRDGCLTWDIRDIFNAAWSEERVFYLRMSVTIPAKGSVKLSASLKKQGSYNYACGKTDENDKKDKTGKSDIKDAYGYDLVTKLGSKFEFTKQTAAIEDHGNIAILNQNFGFDLQKGIKKVELDRKQEHYYMEIQRITK